MVDRGEAAIAGRNGVYGWQFQVRMLRVRPTRSLLIRPGKKKGQHGLAVGQRVRYG